MVGEYTFDDLNPFKFIETCFMTQNNGLFGLMFCVYQPKDVYSAFVECSVNANMVKMIVVLFLHSY